MTKSEFLSTLILALASGLGVWAFLYPFFTPAASQSEMAGMAHAGDAPLIFILLLGLCLVVIVANLETRRMDARVVAVLGVMVGINATLRLVPGPAGFSAMFFLPILCGYAFGADFGFLIGALSMLVSGIITSGMGPWLPFQMFAAGWMGLVSGWLPHLSGHSRLEVLMLAAWGTLCSFIFGLVMNLWFWPFLVLPGGGQSAGELSTTWQPGIGLLQTVVRYGLYYLTTSLWWDAGRAIGNLLLLLLLGAPVLRLLRRFRQRFQFSTQ
ncbi:MAG: ECF transporter S component [Anaerolineales bacterium]|nr:MAG: ECF transporter S component [Anaerolineales bacterium]